MTEENAEKKKLEEMIADIEKANEDKPKELWHRNTLVLYEKLKGRLQS